MKKLLVLGLMLAAPFVAFATEDVAIKEVVYATEEVKSDTFLVYGDFDYNMQKDFLAWYEGLSKDTKEIHIRINSYGGQLDVLSVMTSRLRDFDGKIFTYNDANAMSCGIILFLEGDVRIGYGYSMFMSHGVAFGARGKQQDLEEAVGLAQLINGMYISKLKSLGISDKVIAKELLTDKDIYLTTAKMKELGLVTESR